jgi:hypothetical protein
MYNNYSTNYHKKMLNVRDRSQSRFRSQPAPPRPTKPRRGRSRNIPTVTLNKLRLIGDTVDTSFRLCESSLRLVDETNELVDDVKQILDSVRAGVYHLSSPNEPPNGSDAVHDERSYMYKPFL